LLLLGRSVPEPAAQRRGCRRKAARDAWVERADTLAVRWPVANDGTCDDVAPRFAFRQTASAWVRVLVPRASAREVAAMRTERDQPVVSASPAAEGPTSLGDFARYPAVRWLARTVRAMSYPRFAFRLTTSAWVRVRSGHERASQPCLPDDGACTDMGPLLCGGGRR
jgi:hypothetical protein